MPGLVTWHRSHQDAFIRLRSEVVNLKEMVVTKIDHLSKETKMDSLKAAHKLSLTLQKLSDSYSDSFEAQLNDFTTKMGTDTTTTTDTDITTNLTTVNDTETDNEQDRSNNTSIFLEEENQEKNKERRERERFDKQLQLCAASIHASKMSGMNGMVLIHSMISMEASKEEKRHLELPGERVL